MSAISSDSAGYRGAHMKPISPCSQLRPLNIRLPSCSRREFHTIAYQILDRFHAVLSSPCTVSGVLDALARCVGYAQYCDMLPLSDSERCFCATAFESELRISQRAREIAVLQMLLPQLATHSIENLAREIELVDWDAVRTLSPSTASHRGQRQWPLKRTRKAAFHP